MSTDTLNAVVDVVKDRTSARASTRRFYLDNGRRMWGLPKDEAGEESVKVEVEHKGIPQDGVSVQHQGLPTGDIAVHHDGIPQQPAPQPVQQPVQTTTALPKWATLGFFACIIGLAIGIYGLWWSLNALMDSTPGSTDATIIKEEGSVLQYLEDIGEHRP